jgi:hypothetical protein
MRFPHVNGQEIGVILIVVVDLDDVADLATEGRSGKAAENEDEGPASSAFADVKTGLTIESEEPGVRRIVAHFEGAPMHVRERVPHHIKGIFRASRHIGKRPDGHDEKAQNNSQCPFQEPLHAALLQQIVFARYQKANDVRNCRTIRRGQLSPMQLSSECSL